VPFGLMRKVILTGHIFILSAILALLVNLIAERLPYWLIPDWALFIVSFAILGMIEFPSFFRGRKTLTERIIQRLIKESRLRDLMGYIAMGLFILGTLLYFKATGKMLDPLPDWGPDI
jgi:hypothetical protein